MNTISERMEKRRYNLFVLIAIPFAMYFILIPANALAEEQAIPPWMHKDVLQAALDIGMNAEQSPQFKVALTRYFDDLNSGINKLIRRNPTGLERAIKRKSTSVRKRMDKDMAKFLDAEQMSRYYIYRDLLLSRMNPNAKVTGPSTLQGAPSSHDY